MGDSLTWGKYGGDFVAQVAHLLPEHTITNAGVGGFTILNLLAGLDDVLAAAPDLIFVMVGGNDALSSLFPALRPYYRQVHKVADGFVPPEVFARAYRDLLTRIQLAHVQAAVGLPPAEYNPEVAAIIEQYNNLAREAAASFNIPLLDVMARFKPAYIPERPPLTMADINLIGARVRDNWDDYETEREQGGYSFTFDGLHLTPEAAHQLAIWIAEFLAL